MTYSIVWGAGVGYETGAPVSGYLAFPLFFFSYLRMKYHAPPYESDSEDI